MGAAFTYHLPTTDTPRAGRWLMYGPPAPEMRYDSYPVFDFMPGSRGDAEPIRHGAFIAELDAVDDVMEGVREGKLIVEHFEAVYGIAPEQWRLYLSGKRSVHLTLPAEVLGLENGHKLLPLIYKRLALDLTGNAGLKTLDLAMYKMGTGQPFRLPNRQRDNGLYKVPMTSDEVYEISDAEDYKEFCSALRPEPARLTPARSEALAEKIAAFTADAEEAAREKPEPLDDETTAKLRAGMPACIAAIFKATKMPKSGKTFNEVSMQLIAYAVTAGLTEAQTLELFESAIGHYPSPSKTPYAERLQQFKARYRYMAANAKGFSCAAVLALGFAGFNCDACSVTGETETPDTPEAPALKSVSLANLQHAELDPPKYATDQLVPLNEVTLLGGHGGTGKTLLALIHAAHKACGRAWFGFAAEAGRVVYLSFEDPAEVMLYRLKKICQVYDLPYGMVIENLTILDGSDIDGMLAVETSEYGVRDIQMTPLFEDVKVACAGAGLVIIDNASDAFGGNEISRMQVRKFIRCLRNGIARPNNAGVVLLAHIDKAGARGGTNENTYSGSTAWHNSVRSRLALTAKNNGTVELVQEKLNLGRKLDRPIPLTWVDGILVPDSNIAEGLVSEAQDDLDKSAVLGAIRKAISDGESIPTARTGPKNTHGTLERFPDLPRHLRGGRGRAAFYTALTALHREGMLQVEEYQTPARHIRERFICADSVALNNTPYTPAPEPAQLAHAVSGRSDCAGLLEPAQPAQLAQEEDLIL